MSRRDTRFVRGLDEALRTFDGLSEKAATGLVRALNRSVIEMADRVRTLAPTDGPPATIKDSVATDMAVAAASRRRSVALSARVFIPNDPAFFARYLEFGTVKMRARPFFFVAIASMSKRARARVKSALARAAREVAGRGL